MAQRHRTAAARLESTSVVCGRPVKEYTTALPHELTDRLFVVRRAFRVNDALPNENTDASSNSPRRQWQRGGWLLVDRLTGDVSRLNLPEFDPFYSTASWYRDYIAYGGVSEDGKKLDAVVVANRPEKRKKEASPREVTIPTRSVRLRSGNALLCEWLSARRRAEASVLNTKPRG